MLFNFFLAVVPIVAAIPAPVAEPTVFEAVVVRAPEPTGLSRLEERDILDDVQTYVEGVVSDVGSEISGFLDSGILDFPTGFPTGTAVSESLGLLDDDDLDTQPTQVLNVPAYGNWTDQGWNVRVHGNVYKIPDVEQEKIDDLANIFLIDTDIEDLSESERAQARNVTKSIFVVQQDEESVVIRFVNDVDVEPDASGGAINARGGEQNITLPYETTEQGDFDAFVLLKNTTSRSGGGTLIPGNETRSIQTLNMYAEGRNNSGNSTAYLVPPTGITILSDIDDILRVTKIYEPKEGLLNTFARPFTPWMNMPQIYANWSASIPDFHFHYLTTTPEQVTRNYMDFIYKTYPLGSFDTRPLNFSDISATLSIRRFLLDKIFQTFPQRQFILVGDTTNSDVMKAYPALYHDYPDQVLCIFLRNTSSTDEGNKFPYNTEGFKDIPQAQYMFFNVPDDLTNLDIENGQCRNLTIEQDVTFDYQGLPFGDEGAASTLGRPVQWLLWSVVTMVTMMMMMM